MARVTGHVKTVERKRGAVFYLKTRVPGREPEQTTLLLGPKWAEKGRPPAGYYTDRTAAEALQDYLADARRGTLAGAQVRTGKVFADAVAEWLRWCEHDKELAGSTLRDYANTARNTLTGRFGADTPLERIDTDRVEEYRGERLANVSRRTVQKELVLLHGIFARAVRKRWITANPVADAEKVQVVSDGSFNVLTPEQVYALEREASDATMGALFVVGAFTGLRCPGEPSALRWRHVDFADRIVHVVRNYVLGEEGKTKGKRVRSVPLADQAFVVLDRLSRREHHTAPDDFVFCTELGERLTGDAIRGAFYEALLMAGLGHLRWVELPTERNPGGVLREDPIVPYDLRHTFGTLAVRKAPLSDVQAWLGHQDVSTTMRYVHYTPQHDAAARLSAAFAPEGVSRTVSRTAEIHA